MSTTMIKTRELAECLGISRKSTLERAQREGWICVEKSGGLQWVVNRLPMDVRFKLYGKIRPMASTDCEAGHQLAMATDKARTTASWRSALLLAYRQSGMRVADFIEAYNSGISEAVIYQKLGPVSAATFYRWYSAWKKSGAGGILPKYGQSRGGAGESLGEIEKDLLRKFWLQSTQPTMSHAWRLMMANCPYSKCTYTTARRYLESIPKTVADYHRLGKTRFENMYLPYIEQEIKLYKPMDRVVSDHHVLDCVCMYNGKLIRPWITTMQDYRTGKILGFCPTVKPSSASIIIAYYMVCYQYGVPRELLFDNGKDYRSKLLNGYTTTAVQTLPDDMTEEVEVKFSGIFNMLGSQVHFTRPYNGKSKGRQERYFRIIGEYLAKDFGTYMGSDSRTRPEEAQLIFRSIDGMAKREDIPSWDKFKEDAEKMIVYINDNFKSQGDEMEGKTRSELFDKYYDPESIRHVSPEELAATLTYGEVRKVGRNGVKVGKRNYWHPDLFMYGGTNVQVHVNLTRDDMVAVYTLQGKFICKAIANVFRETESLDQTIERKQLAHKISLQKLAETGLSPDGTEVEEPQGFRTMIDVTAGSYHQGFPDMDKVLETDPPEVEPKQITQEPEKIKSKKKILDPMDAKPEEFLHINKGGDR